MKSCKNKESYTVRETEYETVKEPYQVEKTITVRKGGVSVTEKETVTMYEEKRVPVSRNVEKYRDCNCSRCACSACNNDEEGKDCNCYRCCCSACERKEKLKTLAILVFLFIALYLGIVFINEADCMEIGLRVVGWILSVLSVGGIIVWLFFRIKNYNYSKI